MGDGTGCLSIALARAGWSVVAAHISGRFLAALVQTAHSSDLEPIGTMGSLPTTSAFAAVAGVDVPPHIDVDAVLLKPLCAGQRWTIVLTEPGGLNPA